MRWSPSLSKTRKAAARWAAWVAWAAWTCNPRKQFGIGASQSRIACREGAQKCAPFLFCHAFAERNPQRVRFALRNYENQTLVRMLKASRKATLRGFE